MSPPLKRGPPQPTMKGGSSSVKKARKEGKEGEDIVLAEYERWLKDRGVWWDEELVQLRSPLRPPKQGDKIPPYLLNEWGIMTCGKKVKKGHVICKVPRSACLGEDLPEQGEADDTQAAMAGLLLRERARGAASALAPKLATLPISAPVPWNWPQEDLQLIKGTELEQVVMVKIACLAVELASASASSISLADYTAACSSAISHANPWFGVSMVPFVDMGNHADDDPHVEFRLKQGHVVGTAIRSIPPNSEVYQSYGELGTADLMYRYGFARVSEKPVPGADTVSFSSELLAKACGGVCHGRSVQLESYDTMDHSPWDGLGHELTVELSMTDDNRVGGLAELLVSIYVMMLPEADWNNLIRLSMVAGIVLSGRAAQSDIPCMSLYIAIEALESEQCCPRAAPLAEYAPAEPPKFPSRSGSLKRKGSCPAMELEPRVFAGGWAEGTERGVEEEQREVCGRICDTLIARLQEEGVMGGTVRAEKPPAADRGGEEDEDDESEEEEEEEGVTWGALVGGDGSAVEWLRSAELLDVARAVLEARDAAYPSSEPLGLGSSIASDLASLQGRAEDTYTAMALRLRIVERKIVAAALASLP